MSSKFVKNTKGMVAGNFSASGILHNDCAALSLLHLECTSILASTIQLEDEDYMGRHPEILAMLKMFTTEVMTKDKRGNIMKQGGYHFTRPYEVLDREIRDFLKCPPGQGPYTVAAITDGEFATKDLGHELLEIIRKHSPLMPEERVETEPVTPLTKSSSFISILTSLTTISTPEPVPTPEPTLSEILYNMVSNCVDKATLAKLTDDDILYDTAYVELMKAVEEAMEIPVKEVRLNIIDLLKAAHDAFDSIMDERERIDAEIAGDRRMRKKLKRTFRRQNNFKGYETPPTPKSGLPSSHASYRVPPPRPCTCHAQWTYNRYPKDRFGIYMPLQQDYLLTSITVSPVVSCAKLNTNGVTEETQTKEMIETEQTKEKIY